VPHAHRPAVTISLLREDGRHDGRAHADDHAAAEDDDGIRHKPSSDERASNHEAAVIDATAIQRRYVVPLVGATRCAAGTESLSRRRPADLSRFWRLTRAPNSRATAVPQAVPRPPPTKTSVLGTNIFRNDGGQKSRIAATVAPRPVVRQPIRSGS